MQTCCVQADWQDRLAIIQIHVFSFLQLSAIMQTSLDRHSFHRHHESMARWKSASVINSSLVDDDPTIRPPGFVLAWRHSSNMNHFQTNQGHCASCHCAVGLATSDSCLSVADVKRPGWMRSQEQKMVNEKFKTCDKSRVHTDHPRCRITARMCMYDYTHDISYIFQISSKFVQDSGVWSHRGVGANFDILATGFYHGVTWGVMESTIPALVAALLLLLLLVVVGLMLKLVALVLLVTAVHDTRYITSWLATLNSFLFQNQISCVKIQLAFGNYQHPESHTGVSDIRTIGSRRCIRPDNCDAHQNHIDERTKLWLHVHSKQTILASENFKKELYILVFKNSKTKRFPEHMTLTSSTHEYASFT